VRFHLAVLTTRAVNATSRRLGRGQGTVAGGRSGLKVDPRLLEHLTSGREVSLVTGTNGKTTTTRLLAVALGARGDSVVSNETGSNMPPGHVAALAGNRAATRAVLEVDEIYLPRVLAATRASCVVLLNLSRDQLDRTNEVRIVAGNWRAALAAAPHVTVVANADDPLVAWAAGAAARVRWVAVGLGWQLDAVGCPSCEGRIAFAADGSWACVTGCGFTRPAPAVTLTATDHGTTFHGIWVDGRAEQITLALPGRFNYANALMAAVAAEAQGIDAGSALAAMGSVDAVAGRFTTRTVAGVPTRLMLAKNPAGWSELLDLVGEDDGPMAVGRALRAPRRPGRRGHGRPLPRPVGAFALRRSRPRDGGRSAGRGGGGGGDRRPGPGSLRRRHRELHGVRGTPGGAGMMTAALRIVVVYPDLLGTYGDGGNGLILARRAEWRGVEVALSQAPSDAPLPDADIYCLGGGEDGPQVRAARSLMEDGVLARRAAEGAVVLAVCAGYQIVGTAFPGADGAVHEGVGLLDIATSKGAGPRAVGEVVAEATAVALPALTGFENHGGSTTLAPGAVPLARVVKGIGNGDGSGTEGAVAGHVVGTYLHGPVLARNPALADLLLGWALDGATLAPLDDGAEDALRLERFATAGTARRRLSPRRQK
jgi:CobQ-like glutamine amidotransferase family enzyme